jgi:hypothetical protein
MYRAILPLRRRRWLARHTHRRTAHIEERHAPTMQARALNCRLNHGASYRTEEPNGMDANATTKTMAMASMHDWSRFDTMSDG